LCEPAIKDKSHLNDKQSLFNRNWRLEIDPFDYEESSFFVGGREG
jgi:hypothetical protein